MPYLKLWKNDGRKYSGGFTLIEILVAVSIIAVLSLSAFIVFGNLSKRSRDTRRQSDLEQLRQALEMYRSFYGFYPALGGAWVSASSLGASLVPNYIAAIPSDPKNTGIYVYYYKALTPISGNYYAYCLSAGIEGTPSTSTCTANAGQNYGLGNP